MAESYQPPQTIDDLYAAGMAEYRDVLAQDARDEMYAAEAKDRKSMVNRMERKMLRELTRHRFEELVDEAANICLGESLPPLERQPLTPEQQLVQSVGAWGLRATLTQLYSSPDYTANDSPYTERLNANLKSLNNERYFGNTNHDPYVIQRAEQLGQHLLDTAYLCLGPEVDVLIEQTKMAAELGDDLLVCRALDKASKLLENLAKNGKINYYRRHRQANGRSPRAYYDHVAQHVTVSNDETTVETDAEQLERVQQEYTQLSGKDRVAHWTEHTIEKLCGEYLSSNTDYSTLRLSPRIIGRYPDATIQPTCLGASIIMSSFLEQTGLPHLHSGVMRTGKEHEASSAKFVLKRWDDFTPLEPDQLMHRTILDNTIAALDAAQVPQPAYHDATAVKLPSGNWVELDPYMSSTQHFSRANSKRLNAIYDGLMDLKSSGVYTEAPFARSFYTGSSPFEAMGYMGYHLQIGLMKKANYPLSKLLLEADPEHLADDLFDELIHPLDSLGKQIDKAMVRDYTRKHGEIKIPQRPGEESWRWFMRQRFHDAVNATVLHGQTAEEVLWRCHRDRSYLRNRIDDCIALPQLLHGALLGHALSSGGYGNNITRELGHPAARVGLAVLAQFSNASPEHGDVQLPNSFWLDHWPSYVTLTENTDSLRHIGEHAIWNNHVIGYQTLPKDLRYSTGSGIIKKLTTLGNKK